MGTTNIEWTDVTWNPTRGCSRVSEGCRNCYAERVAARFSYQRDYGEGIVKDDKFYGFAVMQDCGPRWTGKVELIESKLEEPLHWRKPRKVFVNSMSDLFHEELPFQSIALVYAAMLSAPWHTYQVLTKRPKRRLEFFQWLKNKASTHAQRTVAGVFTERMWLNLLWLQANPHFHNPIDCRIELPADFIWEGVSVENQPTADERIVELLKTPAAVRFVSYEPALGPVDFLNLRKDVVFRAGGRRSALTGWTDLGPGAGYEIPREHRGIDWLICGGESGPGARPFDIAWARSVRDQCKAAGVAFFMKQMGANIVDRNDAGFDGDTLSSWPMDTKSVDLDSGYQGAPVSVRLKDRKGGDMSEWAEELRIREFPEPRTSAIARST